MPVFHYEAITPTGENSKGSLTATDRGEAVRKLARRGLQPFTLNSEESAATARTSAREKATKTVAKPGQLRLTKPQIIQFTEELCDLLSAGLQLESALHAMENRSSVQLRTLAMMLREQVRDGVPFSSALHYISPSFGDLYCNLVAAGEASGALPSILQRQVRYLNQMESLRAKVISAFIYPSFIVVSGIALGVLFLTYLLPKLTVLIKNTRGDLPKIAEWMLALSGFLKEWWWLLITLLILLVIVVKVLFQNKTRLAWWHRVELDLPVYGPVLRTRFEVQFLETLGNLLHNGLPLHRSLELARKATQNLYLNDRLGAVHAAVADGGSLSRSLEKTGIARPLVIDMIRVGEQTGEMAPALQKAAERFDAHFTRTIDRATALLQPVIIVCMAVMVGSMAWMMISVVYGTLEQMRR